MCPRPRCSRCPGRFGRGRSSPLPKKAMALRCGPSPPGRAYQKRALQAASRHGLSLLNGLGRAPGVATAALRKKTQPHQGFPSGRYPGPAGVPFKPHEIVPVSRRAKETSGRGAIIHGPPGTPSTHHGDDDARHCNASRFGPAVAMRDTEKKLAGRQKPVPRQGASRHRIDGQAEALRTLVPRKNVSGGWVEQECADS